MVLAAAPVVAVLAVSMAAEATAHHHLHQPNYLITTPPTAMNSKDVPIARPVKPLSGEVVQPALRHYAMPVGSSFIRRGGRCWG